MKSGRPTLIDQKKIKEIIFTSYKNNLEAFTVSKNTGLNYKTVLKHYRILDKEIIESEKNDFLRRVKITKERNILFLDTQILSLTNEEKTAQDQIDNALQNGNTLDYEKLSRLKLKISEQLLHVVSEKTNLIATPTADYIIHKEDI